MDGIESSHRDIFREDVGDCWAAYSFEVPLSGGVVPGNGFLLTDLAITRANQAFTCDSVFGPVPDGVSQQLPDLSLTDQPNLLKGIIDVTLPPFNCDASDSSDALEAAIRLAADHSMVAYIPADTTIGVTPADLLLPAGLSAVEYQSRLDRKILVDAVSRRLHQGWEQRERADYQSWLMVRQGFGDGTNENTAKPLFKFESVNYKTVPPSGSTPRANYSHELENIYINLGNNPGAIGYTMWGAQGCQPSNLKIYGTDFFAGFLDAPGSGAGTLNISVRAAISCLYHSGAASGITAGLPVL